MGIMKVITPKLLSEFYKRLNDKFSKTDHSHTKVNGHTVEADVPSDAKFTDTWRPVINNLTTSTPGSSLDAFQGNILDNKITELKKSVSDGKSAIASAITTKGVSTSSDASFSTMADNISNVCSDTTNTHESHILKNQTAYVKGKKVKGTMLSYKSSIIKYSGEVCNLLCNNGLTLREGGRCSLYNSYIEHIDIDFTLSASSGSVYTPKITKNGDRIRISNGGNDNYIQCIQTKEKTDDLTNIDKIVITLEIYSSTFSGNTYLRGDVGLVETSSMLTSNNGTASMLSGYKEYSATKMYDSSGGERRYVILDTSNVTGSKYIGISVVNGGYIDIRDIVFLPAEETI